MKVKVKKWHIPITIICLLSGILLALSLKAQADNFKNQVSNRNEILAAKIKKQDQENQNLDKDIGKLKQEIDRLQKSQLQGQGHLKDFQSSLEKSKALAGLTDVKGPGITVTLDDIDKSQFKSEDNSNKLLIHYQYILSVVNALKVANADAISVNGQRIVTTSDIECGGVIILVNGRPLASPYVIKAIGTASDLEEMVTKYSKYADIKKNSFPVSIEKNDSINISAYKGSFSFPYAKILKEGEK